MLRIAIYARVSTEEQERGVSLEDQETRCRAYLAALGHTVAGVYMDVKSGSTVPVERNLALAMRACEDGLADGIIAVSLDRFSRNLRHTLDLVDWSTRFKYNLISLRESLDTQSAAGRMLVSVLGSMHQFTLESISEKTRSALSHLKTAGKVYGATPWGFVRDGDRLLICPEEIACIEDVVRMYKSHPKTPYQAAADRMNVLHNNRHPRRKHFWTKDDVGRLVRLMNRKGYLDSKDLPSPSPRRGTVTDVDLVPTGEWASWRIDPMALLNHPSLKRREVEGPGTPAMV